MVPTTVREHIEDFLKLIDAKRRGMGNAIQQFVQPVRTVLKVLARRVDDQAWRVQVYQTNRGWIAPMSESGAAKLINAKPPKWAKKRPRTMKRRYMRNVHLEAAIWNLFTSIKFFEETARECERTMDWFGALAVARHVSNFGRNNQIYDRLKEKASEFRHGAELAKLGDYRLIWQVAQSISGDARGFMEQPLHSWMTPAEYREFGDVRLSRLFAYADQIQCALNNALVAGENFLNPDQDCPECSDEDEGFPGNTIIEIYNEKINQYKEPLFWNLPDPVPEYIVDTSVACPTGDEVPWTGVWYPDTAWKDIALRLLSRACRCNRHSGL